MSDPHQPRAFVATVENMVGRKVTTPKGDVVYLAAASKSQLIERVSGMCEMGALQEFVDIYKKQQSGQCHGLAYEFTYALLMSVLAAGESPDSTSLRDWKWC